RSGIGIRDRGSDLQPNHAAGGSSAATPRLGFSKPLRCCSKYHVGSTGHSSRTYDPELLLPYGALPGDWSRRSCGCGASRAQGRDSAGPRPHTTGGCLISPPARNGCDQSPIVSLLVPRLDLAVQHSIRLFGCPVRLQIDKEEVDAAEDLEVSRGGGAD